MAMDMATKAKYVKIRVVDHLKEGEPAVNVTMPIGFVKWGFKMAQTFSPEMQGVDLDWASLESMMKGAEIGQLIHVEDETNHKTVDIWLE